MSNCPNCGAQVAPNSRFCTECGRPLAAPGAGPGAMPPMPTRPPTPQGMRPPMPSMGPQGMPAPPPMQPAPPAPAVAPPASNILRMATAGDIFNDGNPVVIIVTENQLVIMPPAGAPRVEAIPGIRYAIPGDYDGDGTQDLAIFTDAHVWVQRYSAQGAVASGRVALDQLPEHLAPAPFTHDGRAVLMSTTSEQITFYVHHPARGLVQIGSTNVPPIQ